MGWGDEIMVTAIARQRQLKDPRRIVVVDRYGLARWHPAWENNPRIARPKSYNYDREIQIVRNFPGCRPYLDYDKFPNHDRTRPYVYTKFRVSPGEIYLSPQEQALGELARGAIVLEPNIKVKASPNKDWGWERWQRLAYELRDLRLVQMGPRGTQPLEGVQFIPTADIREAAGVLSGAAVLIAPEGGLHHAAAALGIRAVVIFGGFISPDTTGYDMHVNFFTGGKACGMRQACQHCADAMSRITPAEIARAAHTQLYRAMGGQDDDAGGAEVFAEMPLVMGPGPV